MISKHRRSSHKHIMVDVMRAGAGIENPTNKPTLHTASHSYSIPDQAQKQGLDITPVGAEGFQQHHVCLAKHRNIAQLSLKLASAMLCYSDLLHLTWVVSDLNLKTDTYRKPHKWVESTYAFAEAVHQDMHSSILTERQKRLLRNKFVLCLNKIGCE